MRWNNSLWGWRGAGSHGRAGIHLLVGRGGSRMIRFRDTAPEWSCAGPGSSGSGCNAQMFLCSCGILWDPLELARSIPNPCFYGGGKRIAVHTQPVFKNKTKPHSCCLSEQSKRLFLLLLKLLRSVEQEGCDSCRWGGKCFFIPADPRFLLGCFPSWI